MQTVYAVFQRRCSRQLGEVLTTGDFLDAPYAKPGFASGERLNSAVIFGSTRGIPAFFSWGELPYHIHCWLVSKHWSSERDLIISSHKIKHVPCISPDITINFFSLWCFVAYLAIFPGTAEGRNLNSVLKSILDCNF